MPLLLSPFFPSFFSGYFIFPPSFSLFSCFSFLCFPFAFIFFFLFSFFFLPFSPPFPPLSLSRCFLAAYLLHKSASPSSQHPQSSLSTTHLAQNSRQRIPTPVSPTHRKISAICNGTKQGCLVVTSATACFLGSSSGKMHMASAGDHPSCKGDLRPRGKQIIPPRVEHNTPHKSQAVMSTVAATCRFALIPVLLVRE